jgi:hypothetical protein
VFETPDARAEILCTHWKIFRLASPPRPRCFSLPFGARARASRV